MDIRAFCVAFFSDWVGWMSGLGSLLFTIWGLSWPNANQKKGFLLLGAVCFIVACIHIWTIEHRARLSAEDAKKPDISVDISTDMSFIFNDQTMIALIFTATNKGAPSFLELLECIVHMPDGTSVEARLVPNQNRDTVLNEYTLLQENYLLLKFMETPLTRGIKTSAWAIFMLPGVILTAMVPLKTTYEVSFADIEGNTIRTKLLTGSRPHKMFIP